MWCYSAGNTIWICSNRYSSVTCLFIAATASGQESICIANIRRCRHTSSKYGQKCYERCFGTVVCCWTECWHQWSASKSTTTFLQFWFLLFSFTYVFIYSHWLPLNAFMLCSLKPVWLFISHWLLQLFRMLTKPAPLLLVCLKDT